MSSYIPALLGFLATVIAAIYAYKGVRASNSTDKLAKAADLYGEYADRMEKRVEKLEANAEELKRANEELKRGQALMDEKFKESEKESLRYKNDAKTYREVISEVIRRIKDLIEWEIGGYSDPKPSHSLEWILDRLQTALNREEARWDHNPPNDHGS